MKKVLVLEDDAVDSIAICSILDDAGYDAFQCVRSSQALTWLANLSKVDAVVVDYWLERETGAQFLSAMRRFGYKAQAICVSSSNSEQILKDCERFKIPFLPKQDVHLLPSMLDEFL